MPNEQISDFDALAVAPASGDLLAIVDVSDTTDAATGTTKKITVADLVSGTPPAAHAVEHENGGGDEVSVAGLSGVLADPQVPITENVQDIVGAMLVGGEYDDGAGTITVGYLNIPQNSQSAAYTTVMADRGKHILHPAADNNARTFTIDSNANVPYPIGTTITFINEINTVTIAITADTLTLAGAGTTGSRTLAANGIATAIKITSTKWMISGEGLT